MSKVCPPGPWTIGFRQNYSTSYTLIHLTETIKQSLDQGLFNCGILVDLQKAFDTVDHDILLSKLEHSGPILDIYWV